MSDSDASLPLPSPADSGGGDIDDKEKSARSLGRDTYDSNSDSGSSPGKIPTPSTPKDGRDCMSHSLTLLDDIPYPTDVDTSQVPNQDHDDIPLPPDSSRYSPSQVTPGDDESESMMSPSESTESSSLDKKPSTITMKVLGSVQAKKRLLAFSAAKQAAVSYSPLNKKISPLKGVSVFHQAASKKEITKEQTLAIASIKEEETKMKEILAMNSILNEKLKQVKSITENIPKAPPVTAVVNPTIMTSERITDISSKNEEEIFSKKSSSSANSRNLRKKRTSSSSRSRSGSHSMSKSPSVDSRRKRDKRSRSRSRDRGRDRDKDRRDRDRSDRERNREKEKKSSSRKSRSRSRSPKIKKEKRRSKSHSRSPKHKPRDKDKKERKRSKSRSHSRDRGRKRSPKGENKKDKDHESRDRERSRQKEKERELEREKEKEKERKEYERRREEEKKREREEAAERELDKIRKVRMPQDWPDYEQHQYRPADIQKLWGSMTSRSSRSKSPTQSDAKGSNVSKDVPQPTPLSKTLTKQLKSMHVLPVESYSGMAVDYPAAFVKNTKIKPSLTYGCNPLTFSGYYKTRQQVFKEEEADVMHAMSEIISQKGSTVKQFPSSSDVWKSKKKQQEWFAQTDQNFCPSEGSKGIVISHLYSDDEGEDSPAGSLKIKKQTVSDPNIVSTPIPVLQQKTPSSPDSMDSAPSPLLKKKYNSDEPSVKDNVDVDKGAVKEEHRRKRDSNVSLFSYDHSSSEGSDGGERVRRRETKKPDKPSTNVVIEDREREKVRKSEKPIESEMKSKKPYSVEDKSGPHNRRNEHKDVSPKIQDEEDDDMYEEMELEEFPLEKEIVANSKSSDKEKKDKDKHKGKESKDKSKKVKKQKKKKKHHKSKDKSEKKKSSDEDEKLEEHESSDADSARLKTSKKLSKKDKPEKITKEKRHRKRRSKTDSSKGSESSSGTEHTDDSSRKRPKKKRTKIVSNSEDIPLEKSVDLKKSSKNSIQESQVVQPVVEKERVRKEKKKKHDSKSKKKHSKKSRDTSTSSSAESTESESSSSSESSSDSSDEGSDGDHKTKKADKKKKSKKDRKESKKDKGRDKSPDTSDDENHSRRGGGRRDDRGGGGGGLGGGSGRAGGFHSHKDHRDKDRDQSRRDRDRDRDRGDKRNNYGRRRPNGEFGELFDSLGDWGEESFSPRQENEKVADSSPKPTEVMKEQTGTLSHASTKQAQELLTAIDNDPLLQSVFMNEDLSAETLLKQITEPSESDKSTVGSKPLFNLTAVSVLSNWSDDSEEENTATVTAEKVELVGPPSSGYDTARSTDTLNDNGSREKSEESDSSSDDSTDSESSSSSSGSQSDSDSNNAEEKTDLSEVKIASSTTIATASSGGGGNAPHQIPALYDPFADNSDATSGSSDTEKKESLKVKAEKPNHITAEDVFNENNKFYADLQNTMDVLTKYESNVEVKSCSESSKQIENIQLNKSGTLVLSENSPKPSDNILEKKVEISPTKMLNFKISGSKLDKSNLIVFGAEENADAKPSDPQVTKSSPLKKEKTIPVIESKDHVEQFPISVLGSTCNKVTPIPIVNTFTEEHINVGDVDNYIRSESRESHERNRYIKPIPSLRSRSRSYSRSPSRSRSRSRSFSPHRRIASGAPPSNRFHRSGSYERDRALGRPHRRRSPPPEMFFHGRRPYGMERRRHYHHQGQGHPGDMINRRRERERFPRRPMSRSKSRSRSRSISRSRSRSISPRSHNSGYHRSRRMEMFDRDRRGRGQYFDPREQRDRRFVRERDYHDRERSRTPELSPTEMRMRKKHCDFMDDRLTQDDRTVLKDRENKLLASKHDGDLVPVAQKQESPPLQLNIADSTISDSELASRNATIQVNAGSVYIGGISREMLIDHHNSGHMDLPHPHETQLHIGHGHHPSQSLDSEMCSDYNSPPRRLSLDERLEMEMGISLRDEPVHKMQHPHGGYYYPPSVYRMPGHEQTDQGKYLPVPPHAQHSGMEHGQQPGTVPGAWGAAGKGFVNGKPQRTQSQIIQVGNVIQVVPADIPIVPITITSSTKSRRSSAERRKSSVPKRVVTIKVPVVPFTVPVMSQEDLIQMQPQPPTEEENISRLRRKNRKLRREKRMAAKLAKKQSVTIVEEDDVTPGDNKEEETQEISSKENAQLKSDDNQVDADNEKVLVDNVDTATEENKPALNPEDQNVESVAPTDKDGGEVNPVQENKELTQRPPPKKIEILPPPDKGILVAAGFREKTLGENNEKIIKGVKFADGINPGCGTSSSEGEEMASPPPPSSTTSPDKKSKMLRKKKIKVRIVRKVEEKIPEPKTDREEDKPEPVVEIEPKPEDLPPPPPPSPPPCPTAAYPFCPPGILYQVCSQYAVLYAQAMAEKGIDIVFQPSTQIPTMGESLILSDTLGESGLEVPESIDFQTPESALASVHQTSYEHASPNIPSSTESPIQTTGSRIPTIVRTSNSPSISDYGMDKTNCNIIINPMSSESVENAIPTCITRKRISKNIVEVPIMDMDSIPNELLQPEIMAVSQSNMNLDEIPLPMVDSPSKIPIPSGTPPLSFHISSKPKRGKTHSNHIISSKLRNKIRPTRSTPGFTRSTSSSNIIVTPIPDQLYDYNHPYSHPEIQCHSQNTGLSPGATQVSISVSAPHMPAIPPGVDLSRPPPSFTPPPPGTIDFSDPSGNSSVASALGIPRYTDHTF